MRLVLPSFVGLCLCPGLATSLAFAQNSSLLNAAPSAPASAPTNSRVIPQQYTAQDPSRLGMPIAGMPTPGMPTQDMANPGMQAPGMMPAVPPQLSNAPPRQQVLPPGQVMNPQLMLGNMGQSAGVTLQRASWMYQPAPPLRTFARQDIVTIRVDEIARVLADGRAEKRRNSLVSSVLSDWINIKNFKIVPDPLADGDPTIAGQSQSNARAESSVESRESMSFNIAARVVDIRPNGNLVLEARKSYRVNDNLWETSLSGICRAQDIGPDNVVISRDLIDLEIQKEDRGHLRDGYARGWFQRMADRIKPF